MLNAERMWAESQGNVGTGVNAILEVDYSYRRIDGKDITLPRGTMIHVDESRGIGFCDGDYFGLLAGEYSISFQN